MLRDKTLTSKLRVIIYTTGLDLDLSKLAFEVSAILLAPNIVPMDRDTKLTTRYTVQQLDR